MPTSWFCTGQVQKDIREGHAETVAKVLRMIDSEGGIKGKTCCDVGCGTGSLSLPLVSRVGCASLLLGRLCLVA